jgi:FAD synthetase
VNTCQGAFARLCRPVGVAFSFNGGKDSTVLLHLIRAAVVEWQRRHGGSSNPTGPHGGLGGITTFFFHDDRDFPEITEFTHWVNKEYDLDMGVLFGDFKAGLDSLLSRTHIKAIILGTRKWVLPVA